MTRCPNCNVPLTQEELRQEACPSCNVRLDAERQVRPTLRQPEREPEGAWTEPERRPRRAGARALLGWGTVRAALALLAMGVVLTLIAGGGTALLTKLQEKERLRDPGRPIPTRPDVAMQVLLMVFAVGLAVGAGLYVLGPLMSVAVPGRSGARGWAAAHVIVICLAGATLLLLFIAQTMNTEVRQRNVDRQLRDLNRMFDIKMPGKMPANRQERSAEEKEPWSPVVIWSLTVGLYTLGIIAHALFIAALCQIARYLDESGLTICLLIYLLATLAFQVGLLLLFAITRYPNRHNHGEPLPEWVTWVSLGIAALLMIWLLIQAVWARACVTQHMMARAT
jgi:hypothetical protein